MTDFSGIRNLILFTFLSVFFISSSYSQSNLIDGFVKKSLPGWYWSGNITMKYSHAEDNEENGYAEVFTPSKTTPNSAIGEIKKEEKIQIVQNNILSVMVQGINNDVNFVVQLLYDKNGDFKYDEKSDARLESKPVSLNFDGWKEVHFNINEEDFKVVSPVQGDDFSIIEDNTIGFQLSYFTGKEFSGSEILTGVALITERPNKDAKQESASNESSTHFNLRNYPNPFNPETNITYTLNSQSDVKISVYDRLGREVAVIFDGYQNPGEQSVSFNAGTLPSGIYFYRLKTSEGTEVRKMVLAK